MRWTTTTETETNKFCPKVLKGRGVAGRGRMKTKVKE